MYTARRVSFFCGAHCRPGFLAAAFSAGENAEKPTKRGKKSIVIGASHCTLELIFCGAFLITPLKVDLNVTFLPILILFRDRYKHTICSSKFSVKPKPHSLWISI
jgi:hypothetical protein